MENNIAALDLLLAPAVNEPFGRTLVEAAILGTPYVATDDAGHREIFDLWRGGLLQPLADGAEAMAGSALAILDHPHQVVLGPADRRQIIDDLSAEMHAARVSALYERVIADKAAGSPAHRHDADP